MKAWLFLLLIAVGIGVLPLACLMTVDRLHRGEPLQTVLESLPTRMIDIYGEVLADQLKWLHIAQAQPTSSPSPAQTPKDIVSSFSPQPMKESASSPAQNATVPDFRDSEQEVKSHKRLTTYPIKLSNDTVIALWDGRWRVTAHDLHRLHMVKQTVEFRRDPAAATPAFVVYKEQRIHHSQETLVIPGSLTKVFFDRGSETATREETYEVRVTRITWSEDLTRCEMAYNVTGRNSYGEVVDDDDEISFDMELDEDQHIYLHSFPLGAVNFLKIE